MIHAAARSEDERLVWALVDAKESETLRVQRLDLVALEATNTVRTDLRDHPVPRSRVTSVSPYREGPPPPELLRIHAALPLGVAARCCELLGPTPMDDELLRVRADLDRLDGATIQAARAAAGDLAMRAAAAFAVTTGSRALLLNQHAQRVGNEDIGMPQPKQDAVVAVLRRAGRVLVVVRGPETILPGYWAPLSGRVEPGESQQQAVVREVREEVGLEATPLEKVWECETEDGAFLLHWWTAEAGPGDPVLDPREVAHAKWITPEQFAELEPTFPADREFFARVLPSLELDR